MTRSSGDIAEPSPATALWDRVSCCDFTEKREGPLRRARLRTEIMRQPNEFVEAELELRRACWNDRLARRQSSYAWIALVIAVILVFQVGAKLRWPLIVGCVIVALVIQTATTSRARYRLVTALRMCRCPDCNYALRDLSPAGLPELAGPEACPECGAPWPMVPPPVGYLDPADADAVWARRGKPV